MKVITWNVNGIRARHAQVVELAALEQPDVLCLQELKATPAQIPDPLTTLVEYWSYWHGGPGGYSGVSLHLRRGSFAEQPAFSHPSFDAEARIVEARAKGIVFASLYMPNGGKDYKAKVQFMKQVEAYTRSKRDAREPLILCGDLNVARTDDDVHPTLRKANMIGQRAEERTILEKTIGNGMVDVGRSFAPGDDRLYTWWAPWRNMREKNEGWRLDYVVASDALAVRARSCRVLKEFGTSDHAPVVVEFADA